MTKQKLDGRIRVNSFDGEICWIDQYEDGLFGVTSNKGIDTYGNGLAFKNIQKAIKYVNDCTKIRKEDAEAEARTNRV